MTGDRARYRRHAMALFVVCLPMSLAASAQDPLERQPERMREDILYRPPVDDEGHYAIEGDGQLRVETIATYNVEFDARFERSVLPSEDDNVVVVRTAVQEGRAQVQGSAVDLVGIQPLIATLDDRHRLHYLEFQEVPPARSDVEQLGRDVQVMSMLIYHSVPFMDRAVRVGSKWEDEYRVVDSERRIMRMTGTHDLVEFLYDGLRRVAVIESQVTFPIRSEVYGFKVAGSADSRMISEVFVDTGELRTRQATANGTLMARGGVLKGNVYLRNLTALIRIIGPDGEPVALLHDRT